MAPNPGLLDGGLEAALAWRESMNCLQPSERRFPMSHHESRFSPPTQHPTAASPATTYQRIDGPVSESEVAKLAYAKFQARGSAHGFDKQDWEAASRELGAKGHGHGHSVGLTSFK
jgi:hypothetical protein